jgi:general secretion pathway protein G
MAHNLAQIREALDRYFGDRGTYPDRLEDLVERRYLRAVPLNPYTEAADWKLIAPTSGQKGRVYDVADPDPTHVGSARAAERAPSAAGGASQP